MRVPFFASHALQIRYRGTDTTHSVQVDADGGTTAGLLTLTDTTTGVTALDLGLAANDTGSEIVAVINAVTGWEARLYRGIENGPIVSTVDLNTANKFNDMGVSQVGVHWQNVLEYAADIVVAASTTASIDRAMPVCVEMWDESRAECQSVLSGAGTETISFKLVSAVPTVDLADHALNELGDSDWATVSNSGTMAVTSNGTTQVRTSFTLNNSGYNFLKISTVQNASSGETATIGGFWSNGRESSIS
jgi:hypothetical protein